MSPCRWFLSTTTPLGFDIVMPVGEFRENVDLAWGVGLGALFNLSDPGSLAVRADVNFVAFGYSRKVRNLFFDAHQTNSILSSGVGPQFSSNVGPGQLFAFGTIGVSQFATSRSWTFFRGDASDHKLALTVGGGFSADLRILDRMSVVHFSASYRRHGPTSYGTGGDGPVIVSDANMMMFRVAIDPVLRPSPTHARCPPKRGCRYMYRASIFPVRHGLIDSQEIRNGTRRTCTIHPPASVGGRTQGARYVAPEKQSCVESQPCLAFCVVGDRLWSGREWYRTDRRQPGADGRGFDPGPDGDGG